MIWLFNHFLLQVGLLSTGTFVDLFLWQKNQSLQSILQYNLGTFITLPIMALIIAWLIEFVGSKTAYIMALFFGISYAIVLIFAQDIIAAQPLMLGLIRGISLGAISVAAGVVMGKNTTTDAEKESGRESAIETIAGLILPPFMALSVFYFGSYQLLFIIGAASFILVSIISLFLTFPDTDLKFNFLTALSPLNANNPEKFLLAKTHFFSGIKQGFFFSILGIIILQFTGDLKGWSIFMVSLSLLAIVLNLVYTRLFQKSQSLIASGVGAVIFTLFAVVFITNFNLFGLVIFAIGSTILSTIFGIGLESNIEKVEALDTLEEDLSAEYFTFRQIYQGIGRLIPILALILLRATLTDPGLLEAVIIVISLVPFTIMGVISKSYALRHAGALEESQNL